MTQISKRGQKPAEPPPSFRMFHRQSCSASNTRLQTAITMGNTASLANDAVVDADPTQKKNDTTKRINQDDDDDDDDNGGRFKPGDSFSLSKEGDHKKSSVFIPRYPKGTSEEDDEETDTYISTEGGTTTKEDGSDQENDESYTHTGTRVTTTVGEDMSTIPPNKEEAPVEEGSLETDMAEDGDDDVTIEERRIGRRATNRIRQETASGEEESIQILDAEEEFSHIITHDQDEDLILRKARHQHQAKMSTNRLVGYFQKRRQKEEPPEVTTSPVDRVPVVEGVDASMEDRNNSMLTGPVEVEVKYPHLSEIQSVISTKENARDRSDLHHDYASKTMMIVVASSDIEPPAKKNTFFSRTVPTRKDCVHQIPWRNLLREHDDKLIPGSEVSSVESAQAIASGEEISLFDDNDTGKEKADHKEKVSSPRSIRHISSARLPTSPLSDSRMVGNLLRVHDGAVVEKGAIDDAAVNEIDMSIVTRFVQTFNTFLRKNPRFASLDPLILDSLRVVKLQKLLTTLSEVESELEEFNESTDNQKKQFSLSYHTKLVDCTRKKASRKIELLRSFEGLRQASKDLEKNLIWELMLAFEARAKREFELRNSLAKLSINTSNPVNLLPDAQAPAIQKVLWTETFSPDEIKQLQIENAFLRAETSVLEQKLSHLIAESKEHSWVDAVFRRINAEQLSLLREHHEAQFNSTQQL